MKNFVDKEILDAPTWKISRPLFFLWNLEFWCKLKEKFDSRQSYYEQFLTLSSVQNLGSASTYF